MSLCTLPAGFLDLPRQVYRDDPFWIPESDAAVARAFDRAANPWFVGRESQTWCEPGRARLAAFHDPRLALDGEGAAFFGYFESTGDEAPEARLFAAAGAWARARGARSLVGPIDFSTFGRYRLRLSAEPGAVPFPGEPYGRPGYAQRLEAAGFARRETYVTQVADADTARSLRDARRDMPDRLRAQGYRFDSLRPAAWRARLPELHRLADAIFGGNFAYTPLPFAAFAAACGEALVSRCCPRTSVVAYGPGGDLAGLFLVQPHYGPLVVQEAGNERVPVEDLRYADHWPRLAARAFRQAVLKTVGVAAAHRRRGLMEAMTVEVLDRGDGLYDAWLGALIREGNPSRRFGAAEGVRERTYALYARAL